MSSAAAAPDRRLYPTYAKKVEELGAAVTSVAAKIRESDAAIAAALVALQAAAAAKHAVEADPTALASAQRKVDAEFARASTEHADRSSILRDWQRHEKEVQRAFHCLVPPPSTPSFPLDVANALLDRKKKVYAPRGYEIYPQCPVCDTCYSDAPLRPFGFGPGGTGEILRNASHNQYTVASFGYMGDPHKWILSRPVLHCSSCDLFVPVHDGVIQLPAVLKSTQLWMCFKEEFAPLLSKQEFEANVARAQQAFRDSEREAWAHAAHAAARPPA